MTKLRVIVYGQDGPGLFAREITDELNWLGHSAELVPNQWSAPASSSRRVRIAVDFAQREAKKQISRAAFSMSHRARQRILEFGPDIIITPDSQIPRTLMSALRSAGGGAPIVLWFPDSIQNYKDANLFLAGFDLILLKDRWAVNVFRERYGMSEVHFLPEAATSLMPDGIDDPLSSAEQQEFGDKVVVVGSLYPSRLRLLDNLAGRVPLALYGTEPRKGYFPEVDKLYRSRYVVGREKFRIFRNSLAVLNNIHYAEVGGVNHRIFDAAAAGACVLVDDVPQIEEYFTPGAEILTYQSVDHLVNIVANLTPEISREIGDAARRRSNNEHRLEHRLDRLLKLAGLDGASP